MARIKYGQIGTTHAHASKITAYRKSPNYEVVGIVEPDARVREKAQKSAAYKDLPWLTREQLLNIPGLQVVGVETPVSDLLDTAEVCIAAGKHIHLDKPAGESLPQYRRLLDAAARQHLAIQMGYMFRYNPAVVLLRQFLKDGWLGEPFEVHAVMSKVVDADTRKRFGRYPGGSMFELGCHVIDLLIGALGAPQTVHPFPRHSSKLNDGVLDNMLAVFEYPNATATIRSSFNEVEGIARRHFVLCGSEGSFHIQPLDDPKAVVALSKPRGRYHAGIQEITFPKYNRYVDDAADLARIVRLEKQSDFSYDHDYTVQKSVLEAAAQSTVK